MSKRLFSEDDIRSCRQNPYVKAVSLRVSASPVTAYKAGAGTDARIKKDEEISSFLNRLTAQCLLISLFHDIINRPLSRHFIFIFYWSPADLFAYFIMTEVI
ncbi:hypothetical protein [Salibacterium aidingense]|uniref:hypothetical protein n=1 Tax=Salibacterium aidingense TaxID=384933 RepID=UPI00047E5437|nr:hypothetical protein [Salibacterium aidingense]